MQPQTLSKADSRILAQVFDPESGPAKAEVLVDPYLPADRHITDPTLLINLQKREKQAIALVEKFETFQPPSGDASPHSKTEVFNEAIAILDELVTTHASYASARNNRAQLRRWRYGDRHLLCQSHDSSHASDNESVAAAAQATFSDLHSAIALASPAHPHDAVSPAQGRLLAQAHTQLAAILYAASKDMAGASDEEGKIVVAELEAWTSEQLEEEASRLFYLGGLYGNEVAKALAVHTNPHAKLCGRIVGEAMRKEVEGYTAAAT